MSEITMKITNMDGRICLSIGPIGCVMSADDAEAMGYDLIVAAADLKATAQAAKEE